MNEMLLSTNCGMYVRGIDGGERLATKEDIERLLREE